MSASSGRAPVRLVLSDDAQQPAEAAPWIGPLVALGGMASRYSSKTPGRQLIVTVSVPRRDFAAVLVGCGWVIARANPDLGAPLAVLRELEPQTPVRVVTDQYVVSDFFLRIDERPEPRVQLRESQWQASSIRAVMRLPELGASLREARPGVGSVARWAGLESTWNSRLASADADLAIVGTRRWLQEDLRAFLSVEGGAAKGASVSCAGESDTIARLVLPASERAATWFTHVYASSRLAEQLPLSTDVRAAILDGAGAIKYLAEIEAPAVVCVLDRSVADETAAEMVVQLRNSRGEPLSLREDLGWRPPAGIEALAFTVAL